MKQKNIFARALSIFLLFLMAMPVLLYGQATIPVLAQTSGCSTSSPTSNAYAVTICFSSPASGATLNGNVTVTAAATFTGTSPGIQRFVFYLNGAYLITDYQSTYTFTLATANWVDGAYTLSAEALLRDGFVTQRANRSVTFANGITTPPANNKMFQPSAGTQPVSGSPFVVVAAGDGASGETNAGKVTNLISTINPNMVLYLGDVYEKGSPTEFYNWYGAQGNNFGKFRSITNPSIGNHEYSASSKASGYFSYWDNIPNYYSYDTAGWHFISLNSNSRWIGVDKLSSQYQWLQQDLADNAGKCTIVYYHHPLYNIGPEGSTAVMSDVWALLAQNNVSIVLNGHDHTYQRWMPLDANGQVNPNGVTEFVAGASGHGIQTITKTDGRVAYAISLNPTAFGVLKLDLNANGANFSYINTSGTTLDSGVIPCLSSTVDTQPPTIPGNFTATAGNATQVNLSWTASTDNTGVTGYDIYRDGAYIASVSNASLSYSDTTVSPSTSYSYTVEAVDHMGNHSDPAGPVDITTPSMPSSLNFPVQADTYVNASNPASNYGSALSVTADASPDLHGYMRFNVSGLSGTPISKARLMIYTKSSSSTGIRTQAVADNSWGEKTTTYSNAPALGSVLSQSGAMTASSWVTLDVTPYITGEGTYSFGITTTSATALSLASREAGSVTAAYLILDLQTNTPAAMPSSPPPARLVVVASNPAQGSLN